MPAAATRIRYAPDIASGLDAAWIWIEIHQFNFLPAEFFEDCDASETSKGKSCSDLHAALLPPARGHGCVWHSIFEAGGGVESDQSSRHASRESATPSRGLGCARRCLFRSISAIIRFRLSKACTRMEVEGLPGSGRRDLWKRDEVGRIGCLPVKAGLRSEVIDAAPADIGHPKLSWRSAGHASGRSSLRAQDATVIRVLH